MEVILKENYPTLGYVGDRVAVRRGFARNYLIPRGIAVEVTSSNARQLKHQVGIITARKNKLKREAEEIAQRLEVVTLEFTLKTSTSGRSFGSVMSKDIETALIAKGFSFDRRQIKLPEPIKAAGDFTAQVKLHADVLAPVAIKVSAEIVAAPSAPKKEKGKKKGKKGAADDDQAAEVSDADDAPAEESVQSE